MADRTTGVLMSPAARPGGHGLSDGRYEHDACGVGFVADLSGRRGNDLVTQALTVLRNLDHRGAKGSDPDTGDGAGILAQTPDDLFRGAGGFGLPEPGAYAAGMVFLPGGAADRARAMAAVERIAALEGLVVLGWRDVPHDPAHCGRGARAVLPHLAQIFVASLRDERGLVLDRRALCLRKPAEHEEAGYFASPPAATIASKGVVAPLQLGAAYPAPSE